VKLVAAHRRRPVGEKSGNRVSGFPDKEIGRSAILLLAHIVHVGSRGGPIPEFQKSQKAPAFRGNLKPEPGPLHKESHAERK
jgi:hypothetical protein